MAHKIADIDITGQTISCLPAAVQTFQSHGIEVQTCTVFVVKDTSHVFYNWADAETYCEVLSFLKQNLARPDSLKQEVSLTDLVHIISLWEGRQTSFKAPTMLDDLCRDTVTKPIE